MLEGLTYIHGCGYGVHITLLPYITPRGRALRKCAHPSPGPQVPEEILQDEQVFDLYQHYKDLQGQFKAVHSHLENLRVNSVRRDAGRNGHCSAAQCMTM